MVGAGDGAVAPAQRWILSARGRSIRSRRAATKAGQVGRAGATVGGVGERRHGRRTNPGFGSGENTGFARTVSNDSSACSGLHDLQRDVGGAFARLHHAVGVVRKLLGLRVRVVARGPLLHASTVPTRMCSA